MPCNSDHMRSTNLEVQLSRVACLLDELNGKPINKSHWEGYHPSVYCKTVDGDALVSSLCSRLQNADVGKYSLEMQVWWRDHQEADKARIERELNDSQEAKDKKAAIEKLTPYERKLLGL